MVNNFSRLFLYHYRLFLLTVQKCGRLGRSTKTYFTAFEGNYYAKDKIEFVEIFKTRSGDKKERFLKLLLKNGYLILKINDCSF